MPPPPNIVINLPNWKKQQQYFLTLQYVFKMVHCIQAIYVEYYFRVESFCKINIHKGYNSAEMVTTYIKQYKKKSRHQKHYN